MAIYVYSTLSNDQQYTSYKNDVNGVAQVGSAIFIAGGANTASKHFVTKLGVATQVTAEELAELKQNELFKLHVANGFITYSETKENPEVVAASMTGRDQSAPLVEQDFEEGDAPVVNSQEDVSKPAKRGRRK